MSNVGEREHATQNRIIKFFQQELGYRYLGGWQECSNNNNIELRLDN